MSTVNSPALPAMPTPGLSIYDQVNLLRDKIVSTPNASRYDTLDDELATLKQGGIIFDLIASLANVEKQDEELANVIAEFSQLDSVNLTHLRAALVEKAIHLYISQGGNKSTLLVSFMETLKGDQYSIKDIQDLKDRILANVPVGQKMGFNNGESADFSFNTTFGLSMIIKSRLGEA